MELELAIYPVTGVEFGTATCLGPGGLLQVDANALRQAVLSDGRVAECEIALARPGEPVRIIHVVDVVEPRVKAATGDYFAGMIAGLDAVGIGRTNVLRGATVVVSNPVPHAQESILDMAGTAAPWSKFATTYNVVIAPLFRPEVPQEERNRAAMACGLRAAIHLARASLDQAPERLETFGWPEPAAGLPRVAYIYYLYSDGFGRERLLFGRSTKGLLPTIIHPNEILDGAITFAGCTHPNKSVTFNHMNNGVLTALARRHNDDLALAGVIIVNHGMSFPEKELSAQIAARLARHLLHCDGAIITKCGGGQADVDLAECCDRCEELGVKTVLIVKETGSEVAGAAGFPLAAASPRADAIVSTGNGTIRLQVAHRVQRVIGGETLYDGTPANAACIDLPNNYIAGSGPGDWQGNTLVSCREF